MRTMKKSFLGLLWIPGLFFSTSLLAYPLDGMKYTGIERLEGYRLVQQGQVPGHRLPPGALLKTPEVDIRLLSRRDMTLPAVDSKFSKQVGSILGKQGGDYSIAILDLSDPDNPVYGEYRAGMRFNPGSIGKIAVAIGIFQALADIYPDDIEARERVLRSRIITADDFIRRDSHKVPFWNPQTGKLTHRRLQTGDQGTLWTYLDWMLSASSNAAASMLMKELMLLRHFGQRYPVSTAEEAAYFSKTSRNVLGEVLERALEDGVKGSGLNPAEFRQGKFFTSEGKRRVPGPSSHATPRELLRFLFHLEQGKVVDRFSSREIKRLLYMTQRRIRYASSPALADAAVYFKSGSLYRCREEEGFECGKYQGNVLNLLNSVAIVEAPAGDRQLFYMVVITTNILKKNAAVLHQSLGTWLHRLIEQRHVRGGGLKN